MAGVDLVLNFFRVWAPDIFVDAVASFSFLTHFNGVTKGVIEANDLVYFASLIIFWLFANVIIVELRKAS